CLAPSLLHTLSLHDALPIYPLAYGGLPLVARAPRDPRRGARGRRGPLLGRPSLGRARAGLVRGPAGAEPEARGAAPHGVPRPWRENSLDRAPRGGAASGGLPHGGHRPRTV